MMNSIIYEKEKIYYKLTSEYFFKSSESTYIHDTKLPPSRKPSAKILFLLVYQRKVYFLTRDMWINSAICLFKRDGWMNLI